MIKSIGSTEQQLTEAPVKENEGIKFETFERASAPPAPSESELVEEGYSNPLTAYYAKIHAKEIAKYSEWQPEMYSHK